MKKEINKKEKGDDLVEDASSYNMWTAKNIIMLRKYGKL